MTMPVSTPLTQQIAEEHFLGDAELGTCACDIHIIFDVEHVVAVTAAHITARAETLRGPLTAASGTEARSYQIGYNTGLYKAMEIAKGRL